MSRHTRTIWGITPSLAAAGLLASVGALAAHGVLEPRSAITWIPHWLLIALGLLLVVCGAALWVPAYRAVQETFGQQTLLTTGSFGLCRHPMTYAAIGLMAPGAALLASSWPLLAVTPVLWLVAWPLLREGERALRSEFGEAYVTYVGRVPCLVPDLRRLPTAIFYPAPSGPVEPGLYAISPKAGRLGGVSAFILAQGEQLLAIDSTDDPSSLARTMLEWNLDPLKVSDVFLTHSDPDHAGGLTAFPNARIHAGVDEEPLIAGARRRFPGAPRKPAFWRYTSLIDDEVCIVGEMRVRALSAPGHTPGSMVYLVNDRLLFAGDLLALRDGRAVPFLPGIGMDRPRQCASAVRLASAPLPSLAWLCTAHTGCTNAPGRALGWLREHATFYAPKRDSPRPVP